MKGDQHEHPFPLCWDGTFELLYLHCISCQLEGQVGLTETYFEQLGAQCSFVSPSVGELP